MFQSLYVTPTVDDSADQLSPDDIPQYTNKPLTAPKMDRIVELEKQVMSLQAQKANEVEIWQKEIERRKEYLEEYEVRLQTEVDTENVSCKI